MAKKKRMTNREKQERAATKRLLQAEGIIPPDKPRLNRKRFIEEAEEEWTGRDLTCHVWDLYIMQAVFCVMGHGSARGISPEAVGAAKVLKLAVRLHRFELELKEKGQDKYAVGELHEYIKDIINA
jgi:hypothetical protein